MGGLRDRGFFGLSDFQTFGLSDFLEGTKFDAVFWHIFWYQRGAKFLLRNRHPPKIGQFILHDEKGNFKNSNPNGKIIFVSSKQSKNINCSPTTTENCQKNWSIFLFKE